MSNTYKTVIYFAADTLLEAEATSDSIFDRACNHPPRWQFWRKPTPCLFLCGTGPMLVDDSE
jgi:hypothetical protein